MQDSERADIVDEEQLLNVLDRLIACIQELQAALGNVRS